MDGTVINPEELPETVVFEFKHRLFSIDGCVFRKTPDGAQIALYIPMGDVQAAMQMSQIAEEFEIDPESDDSKLMALAGQGLQYVRQIYPGDSIPREVLTGKAPWMVDPKFIELATAWVSMLAITWKTGEDISKIPRKDMVTRVATDESKALMETIHTDIAAAIEPDDPKPEHIKELLEKLSQELSYVEALREKFADIRRMQGKIKGLYTTYQSEKAVAESIMRTNSLIEAPIKDMFEKFAEFDTYMCDIISILRRFDAQVNFIRGERDAFRQIHMLWEPLLERWDKFSGGRGDIAEGLARDTYRFAAQHFVRTVDW